MAISEMPGEQRRLECQFRVTLSEADIRPALLNYGGRFAVRLTAHSAMEGELSFRDQRAIDRLRDATANLATDKPSASLEVSLTRASITAANDALSRILNGPIRFRCDGSDFFFETVLDDSLDLTTSVHALAEIAMEFLHSLDSRCGAAFVGWRAVTA